MGLIPTPVLDNRSGHQIAAELVSCVSGLLTVEMIDLMIEHLRAQRALVESGVLVAAICPELTNANVSSPHTVLLYAMAWLVEQQNYLLNQLPERDAIAFHQLFGIEMREAAPATATLSFTTIADTNVTIPAGTGVATADGDFIFETDTELFFDKDDPERAATVQATRTVTGRTQLSANTLTVLESPPEGVVAVTNPARVDSGAEAETIDEAGARARNYQRRAERWVSTLDVEQGLLEDVLRGNGIVKAFDLVAAGDFAHPRAGHTTVVVMTRAGLPVGDAVKEQMRALLAQRVGHIFTALVDPQFVEFNVEADVKLSTLIAQAGALAAVEKNLRAFYAVKDGNFGRPITRAEIVAVIEGTTGVDRIVSPLDGPLLDSPVADIELAPYELPKLVSVTIHVV